MTSMVNDAICAVIERFVKNCYGHEYVVDRDFASDRYRIMNTISKQCVVIDRYQIEHSVSPMDMVKELVDSIDYRSNPIGVSVTGGGGTTMIQPAGNFGNVIRGAIGAPAYIDEYVNQQENQLSLKTKLFNENEIAMISKIKQHLRFYLQSECPHKTFDWSRIVIAGGYFASIINDEPVNDIDLFLLRDFHNKNIIEKEMWEVKNAPAESHMFKVGDMSYMKNDKIKGTLQDHTNKIQYIITQYDTREELVKHFDFKHCCVSYDYHNDKLYITRETFDLIRQKRLVPNPTAANQPADWRYNKFWNKGWKSEIEFKETA